MKSICWTTESYKIELAQKEGGTAEMRIIGLPDGIRWTNLHIQVKDMKGIEGILSDMRFDMEKDQEEASEIHPLESALDKLCKNLQNKGTPNKKEKKSASEDRIDWKEFIQDVEQGEIRIQDFKAWNQAEIDAELWAYNPASSHLISIPRNALGVPEDEILRDLGNIFIQCVKNRDVNRMKATLENIANRNFELFLQANRKEASNA